MVRLTATSQNRTYPSQSGCRCLSQLRVLGFGCDEDGDVGVGVLPERKEILVSSAGVGRVILQGVGACQAEMRERAQGASPHKPAMIEKLLKLPGSFTPLMQDQAGLPAQINRVKRRTHARPRVRVRQLIRSCRFEDLKRPGWILTANFERSADDGKPVSNHERVERITRGQLIG